LSVGGVWHNGDGDGENHRGDVHLVHDKPHLYCSPVIVVT
jgi:hypothetical protein